VSLRRGKCRREQLKRQAHRAGRCAHYHSVKNVQVLGCKRLSLIQENAGDEHLLRLNCAKTERKHPDPTAIQDSAVASQTLNLALKKEELCIAINLVINRKRTCLGRAERLGLLDGSDVNPEHHASEKDGGCGK
jgi:hypothetical protein